MFCVWHKLFVHIWKKLGRVADLSLKQIRIEYYTLICDIERWHSIDSLTDWNWHSFMLLMCLQIMGNRCALLIACVHQTNVMGEHMKSKLERKIIFEMTPRAVCLPHIAGIAIAATQHTRLYGANTRREESFQKWFCVQVSTSCVAPITIIWWTHELRSAQRFPMICKNISNFWLATVKYANEIKRHERYFYTARFAVHAVHSENRESCHTKGYFPIFWNGLASHLRIWL